MSVPLIMFLLFIAITLGITYCAARQSSGANVFFAAGRRITGWQNGIAVAGDYMSAASFLGIAGIIAFAAVLGAGPGEVPLAPRFTHNPRSTPQASAE